MIYTDGQDTRSMVEKRVLFDDLDGTQGAERIELTINGRSWQLDLAKVSREKFDRALEPFLAVAHPVGRHPKPKSDGPTPAQVRAWAADSGVTVSPKGKIPEDVLAAFQEAQRA